MTTLPHDTRIHDLLAVPAEQYDLAWLQESLQVAVELELSTIPPYLCGYWSCQDSSSTAAQLILSVVLQEMLHMGLAANILTSISGTPSINTRVPKYPGGLPGGVMPTLTVYLGGLTKAYVNGVYMNIEYPERGPLTPPPAQETIGQFYDAICAALAQVGPPFTGNNQMQATIGENALTPVKSLADAQAALTEIKEQGEGTSTSPDDGDGSELAHYYRFGEIYNGALLVQVSGNWQYAGAPVPFPATYPMAPVPEGGWPNPPSNVANLVAAVRCGILEHHRQLASGLGKREPIRPGEGHRRDVQPVWPGRPAHADPIGRRRRELRARLLVHPFRLTAGLYFWTEVAPACGSRLKAILAQPT